jgi:hypothetical protein
MRKALLSAALLAGAAGVAHADYTFNLGSQQAAGNQGVSANANLTGTLGGIEVHYDFDPQASGGSWASDAALTLAGPSGGAFQWGGYDVLFSSATFVDFWIYDGGGSAPAGHYTDTRVDIPAPLAGAGAGSYTVFFGNGWSASGAVAYNNVTVTLRGLSLVPAPSAAGLLGLGGLALARRRRR